MSELTLAAQPRVITGRKVRQLRQQGLVPVVVYGKTQASMNLQVDAACWQRPCSTADSPSWSSWRWMAATLHNVLIRDIQRHPGDSCVYACGLLCRQHEREAGSQCAGGVHGASGSVG